jgi:hypothetical protein
MPCSELNPNDPVCFHTHTHTHTHSVTDQITLAEYVRLIVMSDFYLFQINSIAQEDCDLIPIGKTASEVL